MITILKLKMLKLKDDFKMIAVMTGITFVMIAVFASVNYEGSLPNFGYVDEDNTEISNMLFEELNNKNKYNFEKYTLEETKELVKNGDLSGAIYIKENLMNNALIEGSVSIEKIIVSENMNNMQIDNVFFSALNSVISNYKLANGLGELSHGYSMNDSKPTIAEVSEYVYKSIDEHWTYKKPIIVKEETIDQKKSYDSAKHSVIGFSLFFAMFTIVFGIAEILNERENHTWGRQMVSPISKSSILAANMISTFIIGFAQVSLMFVAGKYVFNIDWQGSMLNILLLVAAFVFCVTSLGLFIANFVKTVGQLSAITPIILTGTAMLGGCFWPLEIVSSKILLALANITPQKWALESIKKIGVHGYGFEEVLFEFAVLVAMGLIYLTLGNILLNRKTA